VLLSGIALLQTLAFVLVLRANLPREVFRSVIDQTLSAPTEEPAKFIRKVYVSHWEEKKFVSLNVRTKSQHF